MLKSELKCICEDCPSFVECKEKIAFCLTGKSKCIKEKRGCICGGCPIHLENNFEGYYYCFSGKDRKVKVNHLNNRTY